MTNLATRFNPSTRVLRSEAPLDEDQMRAAAPSVFASGKHVSRSEKYTYIPTIQVLRGLRREGFEPFMVAQGRSRIDGKTEYTKHMIRLRHADQVSARDDANEIILINSHDGASCYQMLAGVLRFACCNGLVVGSIVEDIRIPHRGDVQDEVIDAAFRVLEDFDTVDESKEAMKSLVLEPEEEQGFASAALTLRFGARTNDQTPAPITAQQLVQARRPEDEGSSLWDSFNRIQANSTQGGQHGRSATGRRIRTRPVASIDGGVSLNRALWVLAEEMRRLKG